MFSFTPETDARYVLYQGIRLEKATGALGFLSPSDVYCTVSGERIPKHGRKRIACSKKDEPQTFRISLSENERGCR